MLQLELSPWVSVVYLWTVLMLLRQNAMNWSILFLHTILSAPLQQVFVEAFLFVSALSYIIIMSLHSMHTMLQSSLYLHSAM